MFKGVECPRSSSWSSPKMESETPTLGEVLDMVHSNCPLCHSLDGGVSE